jgi:hypothetical protein
MQWQVGRTVLTAACSVGLTLLMWVLIVMSLDHRFRGYDNFTMDFSDILYRDRCLLSLFRASCAGMHDRVCNLWFGVHGL